MAMTEFRSYKAEAAVEGYRIVKPGSADYTAVKSTGPTDFNIGTSDSLDKSTGEMVDCAVGDIHEVRLGGTVVRGASLTSDANGKAVSTTTVGHRCIGYAEQSGVVDDVITYIRAPHVL
ncbi:hypothetical protein ACG04Q_11875 [Roseateles sp. DXS20W]|uniref:DUF2190 family protein n=1 Tax=Pelomonas lactea TaxID=3299030 RepID=A0ABW7GJZ6_9BURK